MTTNSKSTLKNVSKKAGVLVAGAVMAGAPLASQIVPELANNDESHASHAAVLSNAAHVQEGVLNKDLTGPSGYIYKAGTKVARATSNDDNALFAGKKFALSISTAQGFMNFLYGGVNEADVTITGDYIREYPAEGKFWASQSYVAPEDMQATLWPAETAVQVNKDALKSAINQANTKTGNYTDDSKAAFDSALSVANSVFGNANASQQEVDNAASQLTNAINGLVEKAPEVEQKTDFSALQTAVDSANEKVKGEFTQDSINAVKSAIEAGKAVLDNKDASQADVDNATKAINDAVSGLVEKTPEVENKADFSALESAMGSADAQKDGNFTQETLDALKSAMDAGQAVLDNKDASQADVDAAAKAVNDAIAGLKEKTPEVSNKTDLSVLKAAIAQGQEKAKGNFTTKSLEALNATITVAQMLDEESSQADVDFATKEILKAIDNLVEKQEETQKPDENAGDKTPETPGDKEDSKTESEKNPEVKPSTPETPVVNGNTQVTPGQVIQTANATYVVKPGDTLGSIAMSLGTTVANLLRLNQDIVNPDLIYPGQEIAYFVNQDAAQVTSDGQKSDEAASSQEQAQETTASSDENKAADHKISGHKVGQGKASAKTNDDNTAGAWAVGGLVGAGLVTAAVLTRKKNKKSDTNI